MKVKDIPSDSEIIGCDITGKTRNILLNGKITKQLNQIISNAEALLKYKNYKITENSDVEKVKKELDNISDLLWGIARSGNLGDSLDHIKFELEYQAQTVRARRTTVRRTPRRK